MMMSATQREHIWVYKAKDGAGWIAATSTLDGPNIWRTLWPTWAEAMENGWLEIAESRIHRGLGI